METLLCWTGELFGAVAQNGPSEYDWGMKRTLLKSKIHRATVTEADLDYAGSVTIDATLMERANILPYEQIHVYNITSGTRFVSYAILGEADSGTICINGAAAHRAGPGDLVIIASYAEYSEEESATHEPKVLLVDQKNHLCGSC